MNAAKRKKCRARTRAMWRGLAEAQTGPFSPDESAAMADVVRDCISCGRCKEMGKGLRFMLPPSDR